MGVTTARLPSLKNAVARYSPAGSGFGDVSCHASSRSIEVPTSNGSEAPSFTFIRVTCPHNVGADPAGEDSATDSANHVAANSPDPRATRYGKNALAVVA